MVSTNLNGGGGVDKGGNDDDYVDEFGKDEKVPIVLRRRCQSR